MKKNIIVFLLLTVSIAFGQHLSNEEKEILTLQDQRSLSDGKLTSYLRHPDDNLRYRAAIALANVQDTSTVPSLLSLLKDAMPRVRAAVAFALGQVGSPRSEDSLLVALQSEADPAVFGRLAEALGRCGTERALRAMVDHDIQQAVESARDQYLLAIARLAQRGIRTERSTWFCFDQLANTNAAVRWTALYALWRSAPLRIIDVEIAKRFDNLKKLTEDPSPDVRVNLATLLGKANVSEALDLLQMLSVAERKHNEWRVQVAIVRAYGALVGSHQELLPDLAASLNSPNDHVVITALQMIGSLSQGIVTNYEKRKELEATLVRLSGAENRAELVQGEALVALGRHFPQQVNRQILTDSKSSPRLKSKVLEALSYDPSVETFKLYLHYLDGDSIRVAMAAWDFFRRIANPFAIRVYTVSDSSLNDFAKILFGKIRGALDRNDMAITNLVASTVGDTTFFSLFRGSEYEEKVRDALATSYETLSSPNDTEAMQAVLDALGKIGNRNSVPLLEKALQDPDRTVAVVAAEALRKITGLDYSDKVPAATKTLYKDYDWATIESIALHQTIVLKTTRGEIAVQLQKEHAPFTVLSFYKLVERGFYNGLPFHRVVPNFVIQGGDPRGDGWGGPGYAVRSEYSLVNYDRGMVGMASAGKDTEGCQFFVVHSPQPNLDGRYTIFARVVQGMDVVDTIQVGDRILSVEIGE